MNIEQVLEATPSASSGRHLNDLCAHFQLFQTEQSLLEQRINTLLQYRLIEEISPNVYRRVSDQLPGTLSLNAKGFGFASPELVDAPNLFIDHLDLNDARHKDRVSLSLYTAKDGRVRGRVRQVLERGIQSCVGIFRRQDGGAWLSPQSDQLPPTILVRESTDQGLALNQITEGELIAVALQDSKTDQQLTAIPLHIINPNDPQGQLEAVIYNQGIKLSLATSSRQHAEQFPDLPTADEYAQRRDLRHLPFITIDPDSAQDFDDALYAQPVTSVGDSNDSGWILWVAIADVAHYVKEGDPIDMEARQKSATLYLPAQAFPMLPHRLSNDLCSLKPKVDRLAMVARIQVNNQGDLEGATFCEAVIHSQARLTYDEAAGLLGVNTEPERAAFSPPKHIQRQRHNVIAIRDCARALRNRRRRRGFLNLDLIEPRLRFDLLGMINGFKVSPRHEAHEMVEEAMLAANESVAAHCISESIPALYRVHGTPPEKGIERFVTQSTLLGAPFEPKKKVKAHHLSKYLRLYESHPRSELLSSLLLRSMSRAVYQPKADLHFGLGTSTYLHFTSPIRRYPDLWVHRQLKAWLNQETTSPEEPNEIAGYASRKERLIIEAERKVLDAYKALYMRDHVGQTFSGVVCGTSPKGFLVDLYDYPVWCSHSVDKLPGSFRYDERTFLWRSSTSKRRITLGSEVEVTIISSDVSSGKIEVILKDL